MQTKLVQGKWMKRFVIGIAALALIAVLVATRNASAATYYIAANGSDSNNGTTESTPWAHAPGMTNCSATCGSTTPQPGDRFIFRGGDTWHFESSGSATYVGSGSPAWNFHWSGNSSNCVTQTGTGYQTAGCIYVGVDQTWFSGSSWARPIMNLDNPLSTSFVQNCAYDQAGTNLFFLSGSQIVLDNFEWVGYCWNNGTNAAALTVLGGNDQITNSYFHGWTAVSGSTAGLWINCNGTGCSNTSGNLFDHNVFDGSDSSLASTPGEAIGKCIGAIAQEIAYNVFWHCGNVYVGGAATSVHDNIWYYNVNPDSPGAHGNLLEEQGDAPSSVYFYNNLVYGNDEAVGIAINGTQAYSVYIFNNISFWWRPSYGSGGSITNGTDGDGCFAMTSDGSGAGTWYFFNNTIDSPCAINQGGGSAFNQYFENNQLIGFPTAALSAMANPSIINNGSELFQSESVANGQGYTPSDFYAPVTGGATIGAGTNMTSFCNTLADSRAAGACQYGYGGVTYNQANHTADQNTPVQRPSSAGTGWDIGAYQFNSGSSSSDPTAPTGLTAVVN